MIGNLGSEAWKAEKRAHPVHSGGNAAGKKICGGEKITASKKKRKKKKKEKGEREKRR